MPQYLAITLGPIYKTFQNVRKTRELWAASYIFSYLSRRLLEKVKEKFSEAIFIPYYQPEAPVGIGLYPDRIFLKVKDGLTIEILKDYRSVVLEEIAGWIGEPGGLPFLQQYFRIHILSFETDENPLVLGNELLDTAELRSRWELNESKNELLHFFRGVNKPENKKWLKEHLAETDINNQLRFESVAEISTRAIRKVNKNVSDVYKDIVKTYCYKDAVDEDDAGFMQELQEVLNPKGQKEKDFKNYHKYICIVNADGDKVGKYIKAITEDYEKNLEELSKTLYDWGRETAQKIKDYSGVPIYVGGDDILFLAPVVGNGKKNILQLTEELNKLFVKYFEGLPTRKDKKDNDKEIKPTLSFGISITYYKFPLYEAKAKADELLHKAKETRNSASLSLLKHSGSSFDITLSNDTTDSITTAFIAVSNHFTSDTSFVSSIIQHFRENEPVYRCIGTDGQKVTNYLLNNFEEEKYRSYVMAVAGLCSAVYEKNKAWKHPEGKETASEKSVREIHSYLRILKFLNGLEDGK